MCLGYQVENVCTLFMEITRASQKGEQAASEMSEEIMSKWSTFAPVEQVREEYILVFHVLKLHDAPLVET